MARTIHGATDDELRAELKRREELRTSQHAAHCTGVSARWCPVCGTCTCENPEYSMSDDGCPLHDPSSPHAPLGVNQDRGDRDAPS